eukprot:1657413-Alexandrium_andersonii.AAC.1
MAWAPKFACAMFAARPCVFLARAESEHVPGFATPPRKYLSPSTDAAPQARVGNWAALCF